MNHFKAIVLDLDGTLFNSCRQISPRNQESLRECHANGLHIIIATARPPRAVQHLPADILSMGYFIYYNGALITHVGEEIREHTAIPSRTASTIMDFVRTREPKAIITLEHDDKWYCLEPLSATEYAAFGIGSGHIDSNHGTYGLQGKCGQRCSHEIRNPD